MADDRAGPPSFILRSRPRRGPQLRLAHKPPVGVARTIVVGEVASPLASRSRNEVRLDTARCVRCQQPPNAEGLVIGMCEHRQWSTVWWSNGFVAPRTRIEFLRTCHGVPSAAQVHLVSVHYVRKSGPPPVLFGQRFVPNDVFGLWTLHVWTHRTNPNDLFAQWNPRVHCS